MATVIKSSVFAQKLKNIAANYKTLYIKGCFGAPMTAANKKRYCNNHDYNRQARRQQMINAASEDTFGFDCVCLLKGVLWGWSGDKNAIYGGAKYASNGVPDIGEDSMINICSGISTDFSNIQVGEAVWVKGHIGLYVGDGLAAECTPAWKNKVQITAVGNIGTKSGYNTRKWTKHGKLPYVEYDAKADTVTEPVKPAAPDGKVKVGDIVRFNGNTHYTSSNVTSGKPCKSGEAKVTAVYNGKHPYHLIAISGGGSNVYGWVNAADITPKTTAKKPKPSQKQSKKVDYAQKFDKAVAGRYKVTASSGLHVRAGASTAKSSLGVLKNGTIVSNYGYYSIAANGRKWLYVKAADGIVGFCSSKYLVKC